MHLKVYEGNGMSTELREWMNEIWEYFQEHWVMALAVGAVLLILLVSALLVHSAKSGDEEAASPAELDDLPAAEPEPEVDAEPEPEVDAEPEPEVDAEPEPVDVTDAAEEESELKPVEKPVEEPVPVVTAAQGVIENLLKSVEAASGASGQNVESIELKIEKAQLTIRYVGDKKVTETIPSEEKPGVSGEKSGDMDFSESVGFAESVDFAGDADFADGADFAKKLELQDGSREPGGDGEPAGEDGERRPPKKFGIENTNMARSGRVYTEEELLNQIRD